MRPYAAMKAIPVCSAPPRNHLFGWGVPLLIVCLGLAAAAIGLTAAAAEPGNGMVTITVTRHILYMGADGQLQVEVQREDRTVEEYNLKKPWAAASLPLQVRYNSTGAPAGHDVPVILQSAMQTWNDVGTPFSFSYAGASTARAAVCDDPPDFNPAEDLDGINLIQFGTVGPQILGLTCSYGPPGAAHPLEFDMLLNPSLTVWFSGSQSVPGKFDLPSTVLHELGHAAGLSHSNDSGSVMQSSLASGVMKRNLGADDMAGLRALYPGSASPTPTPTTPVIRGPYRARFLQLAADSVIIPVAATPTRSATATPTMAPPTATPTNPTANATPTPAGVSAHNATWYVSSTGSVWIEGLVTNGTNTPISFVRVNANFYGASGQLLATDFGFAEIDTMAPGTSSPFTVLLIDPPPGISTVDYAVGSYDNTPSEPPVTGLLVAVSNIYRNAIGSVHVVGTVLNNSATAYEYVMPIAAFVDSEGDVIRTDFTFTDPDTLAPGQSANFDILFLSAPAGMEHENLLVWVDANYP